jgi:hypothetical protein
MNPGAFRQHFLDLRQPAINVVWWLLTPLGPYQRQYRLRVFIDWLAEAFLAAASGLCPQEPENDDCLRILRIA